MHRREASALDLFTDPLRLLGDAAMRAVTAFDRRPDACPCNPGCRMPPTRLVAGPCRGRTTVATGYRDGERAGEGTRRAMRSVRTHLPSLAGRCRPAPGPATRGGGAG